MWAMSSLDGDARGRFVPAQPVTDTRRLTTTVTALVRMRCSPAALPVILREAFALHPVLSVADARLQRKLHSNVRRADKDGAAWASSYCEVCFSTAHSSSHECPLHQRRLARRMRERERQQLARASPPLAAAAAAAPTSDPRAPRGDDADEARAAAFAGAPAGTTPAAVQVSIERDDATRGKWGVLVDASLALAPGTERLQPALAKYIATHRVTAVNSSPVATVQQLKIALSASAERASIVLTPLPRA